MPEETPVNETLEMIKKGLTNEEITRSLEAKGYNLQQISDAINQAKIKQGVEGNMPPQEYQQGLEADVPAPPEQMQQESPPQKEMQAAPAQQYQMPTQVGPSYEEMQAIVEQIVEEKWRDMVKDIGDINVFKSRVSDDMEAVKQEILRTQRRLEELQGAVLGKVKDYNQSVLNISSEMKALESVFSKIMEPLSMNVRELSRITEELKK
jgi:hypothetical protein